jgi:hypothetical protein
LRLRKGFSTAYHIIAARAIVAKSRAENKNSQGSLGRPAVKREIRIQLKG